MRLPRGALASSTTEAMRPPSTTTARPRTGSAPVPSISDAPTSTRVSIGLAIRRLLKMVQMRGGAPLFELSGGSWPTRDEG